MSRKDLASVLLITLGALTIFVLLMWTGWEDVWPWIKENVLFG